LKLIAPDPPLVSVIVPPERATSPETFIVPTPDPVLIVTVPELIVRPPVTVTVRLEEVAMLKFPLITKFPPTLKAAWVIDSDPVPVLRISKSSAIVVRPDGKLLEDVKPGQSKIRLPKLCVNPPGTPETLPVTIQIDDEFHVAVGIDPAGMACVYVPPASKVRFVVVDVIELLFVDCSVIDPLTVVTLLVAVYLPPPPADARTKSPAISMVLNAVAKDSPIYWPVVPPANVNVLPAPMELPVSSMEMFLNALLAVKLTIDEFEIVSELMI
jgi:hypothetical protein